MTEVIDPPRPDAYDPYCRYICKRRSRFHARPFRDGIRHYLGSFRTVYDARRAIAKFYDGKLEPIPPFVRPARSDGRVCRTVADADGYIGVVRYPKREPVYQFRTPLVYATRREAAEAVFRRLKADLLDTRRHVEAGDKRPRGRSAKHQRLAAALLDLIRTHVTHDILARLRSEGDTPRGQSGG